MSTVIGISTFELHIPASRSLKDKRRVVKSLIERIRHRHSLSIIESDYHDLHQRSEITLAVVARSDLVLEQVLARIRRLLEDETQCQLTRWEPQFLSSQG